MQEYLLIWSLFGYLVQKLHPFEVCIILVKTWQMDTKSQTDVTFAIFIRLPPALVKTRVKSERM
jgi:hypothetical protein